MQAIASRALASGGTRYVVHPGDPAWWVHHEDPRLAESTSYWLLDDGGLVVLSEGTEINAFTLPGEEKARSLFLLEGRFRPQRSAGLVAPDLMAESR
jgi:hypothetical protein